MKKEGLCSTCVNFTTCIFDKEPVVWQCEEFYSGNNVPGKFRDSTAYRRVLSEATAESE